MGKIIFLLSDQVVHWNIVPKEDLQIVYMNLWGNGNIQGILNFLEDYFISIDDPISWSLLENGLGIEKSDELNPANKAHNHIFAKWRQFPEGKNYVWRIDEISHVGQSSEMSSTYPSFDQVEKADLMLIQDWGMNIRDLALPNLDELSLDMWKIYRPSTPIFQGNLWHSLSQSLGKKDVIVLTSNDLRMVDISISKGLSWEKTVTDIINEIFCERNITLHALREAAYIIISFGHTGTLLIRNPSDSEKMDPEIQFFFDATGVEGYWEIKHPGYLPGSMGLLMVLLAKEILFPNNPAGIDFTRAIRAHLLGIRALHLAGAKISEGGPNLDNLQNELDKVYGLTHTQTFTPVTLDFKLFNGLFQAKQNDKSISISNWSLLGKTRWDFYCLARKIVLLGPIKALHELNIPIAKYNHLVTADRKEIEFLQNLRSLFTEYLQRNNNQPFSIAVFGSPGSGKSFSIKQLAKSLGLPEYEIQPITFNLSQFKVDNPDELFKAFHAVRDISLSGKTPLVFWDEFDSNSFAWLRYFLAPLEDGEFQEGQITHYIGKSIFVFAGGTSACIEEFEVKAKRAILQKGPDFFSRIKGFVNVMGPNPVLPYGQLQTDSSDDEDESIKFFEAKNADPEFIIRRAILLNSLLNIDYKDLFSQGKLQIDDGVLNAFLMVPKYKHGVRSMQTILKTSNLFGRNKFNRSDLPPESQLNLHVKGELFYDLLSQKPKFLNGGKAFQHLVNEINLNEKLVEKMAVGSHAIYALMFESDKVDDPQLIDKEEFKSFYEKMNTLPEGMSRDEVSQNYHSARKIPEKLAAIGLTIVPLEVKVPAVKLGEEEIDQLGRLEHIRWVHHHIDNGWCYSPLKNEALKQHDALVAWDEEERQHLEAVYGKNYSHKMSDGEGVVLDEHYRKLDRVISQAIPWILESVGFKIIAG